MSALVCPNCARPLSAPETPTGQEVRCPACVCLAASPDGMAPSPLTATMPPASHDPEVTVAPSQATPTGPRDERAPDGYEILSELGRGGMGVVYKAKHLKLERIVALKMILSGAHAAADEMKRFHTEAQAIARLQHPGIVAVHEVGEHEGRPFFALEFCPGGGLDRKLAGTPMQPRDAAALVKKLAEAMQTAHDANVIHRDLKPANVLLAADGAPKVTDFGLAKKLDEQGQTQTGSVMGTPSYMAPEQASSSKQVGPAADVYALGAILYECLTGRPPFRAPTPFDTIVQVVSDEPVPPRQLNAKVPRDLETIALKCLSKEPVRRYESARALADDLGRFLADEPIKARPVGAVVRAAKWVKRNTAVAALLALVFAALAGGTTASTLFALRATEQADLARKEKKNADDNAKTAQLNEQKALDEKRQTAKALEKAETALARGVLRPLAAQSSDGPMTETEWEALWELATNRPGRLGVRFVEEATRSPLTSRQLRDRSGLALPSAVGLDLTVRDEVEALLLARMEDANLSDAQRHDLARVASSFDGLSSTGAKRTAQTLIEAMQVAKTQSALADLAKALSAVAVRMEPREAARAAAQAAPLLVSPDHVLDLAGVLATLAARMEPDEAARVAAQAATLLTQAMQAEKDTQDAKALCRLVSALGAVATRMEPGEAAKVCAEAAALLPRAIQLQFTLYNRGADSKYSQSLGELVEALAALATRMEPAEATAMLTWALTFPHAFLRRNSLVRAVEVVAVRMGPAEAGKAAAVLAEAMKTVLTPSKVKKFSVFAAPRGEILLSLARALAAVAARMEPGEAAEACAKAVALLMLATKDAKNTTDRSELVKALAAMAPHVKPADAATACAQAAALLIQSKNEGRTFDLVRALGELAVRLGPEMAADVAALLAEAMVAPNNAITLRYQVSALAAVAVRVERRKAIEVCAKVAALLMRAMKDPRNASDLNALASSLAAMAPHLEPADAATACAQAAALLAQSMKDPRNASAMNGLTLALGEVAVHVAPEDAVALLAQVMKDAENPSSLVALARALAAEAGRSERGKVAKFAAQAAALLTQAMKDPKNANAQASLARSLAAVAAHAEPAEAARVCAEAAARLAQATNVGKDSAATSQLAAALSALAERMNPAEASEASSQAAALGLLAFAKTTREGRPPALAALLGDGLPAQRNGATAVALVGSQGLPLARVTLLAAATRPPPYRLSTQQFVELLKMPTCVPEARRLILDRLGNRYQRHFADQWEFVRFATEQKLGLDFLSPPQRPDRAPDDRR